ncbi:DNA primase, partial [Patescibacteria group bacterium]
MMDQRDEIKQKIDLVELVSEYVSLKKAGRNFKGLCPFHSEDTPSFIVSPERQIFKCFGCNEGGDAFGFLMKMESLDFGEAIRTLAKRTGVILKSFSSTQQSQKKQLLYEINHLASEFYHWLLLNHPQGKQALNYILGRGISKDSLELFKLGFSPNLWDGLQKFLVGKKGYQYQDLEAAGLISKNRQGKYYDRFRGRLMFSLKDHQGNICGFSGRVLQKDVKEAKYINSPETSLYFKSRLLYGLWSTKQEIKKQDRVVLVEGELDAISSYQA